MAETLAVLAGPNAGNAARHFVQHAYRSGDVATAMLWSKVAQALDGSPGAARPAEAHAVRPVPRRMIETLEAAAFAGVVFQDIDADTLAREEPAESSGTPETFSAAVAAFVARHRQPELDFRHPEFDAGREAQPEGARPLPLAA